MQYSQEHLKTMVYAEFGGQTECIMGNWKIENKKSTNAAFRVEKEVKWRKELHIETDMHKTTHTV